MPLDLRQQVYYKLQSLRELIGQLQPHASHSTSAHMVWEVINRINNYVISEVLALDPSDLKQANLIKRYSLVADYLHPLLEYIEAGEPNRIPTVIIAPLKKIITRQGIPDAEVIIWSSWESSNYFADAPAHDIAGQTDDEVFEGIGFYPSRYENRRGISLA